MVPTSKYGPHTSSFHESICILLFRKIFDNCLSFLKSSQLRTEPVVEFRGSEVTPACHSPEIHELVRRQHEKFRKEQGVIDSETI